MADYLLTLPNGLNEPNPNQVNGSGKPIFGNTNFCEEAQRAARVRARASAHTHSRAPGCT